MIKKIVNLIFEWFHLKKIKHEGGRLAWIEHPDSVAEHSLNAAQIGYILAKMEWADAQKVATILVWHDMAETRIWDLHKIATRYIKNKKEIEDTIMKEQFAWFDFEEEMLDLFDQYENRSTLEGNIAKDADYLEQAFQAQIYKETGFPLTQHRIDNVGNALQTISAKKIRKKMIESSFADWWLENDLPNIPRK